jgi:hypothetical protein
MLAIGMPWSRSVEDQNRLNNLMLYGHEIHRFQRFQ